MKRHAIGLAVVLSLLGAGGALANNGWGLYGAYWDGADAAGPGFKLTFELVPALQFDLHVAHFGNVGEDDIDLDITTLEFGLAMNVPLTDTLKLSLGGGPSYNFADGDEADDEIGGYIGACLEFSPYKDVALFLEPRYIFLDPGPEDLNGFGVNLALMVTW